MRTVNRVAHEKKELGHWGGPIYKACGPSSAENSGDSVEKDGFDVEKGEKVVWSYVIEDGDTGHRSAAGRWKNVPPLAKPHGPIHWQLIHARLLLAWLPEHVQREGLLLLLVTNVKKLENITAAVQTWKGLEAFTKKPDSVENLKTPDLEGLVSLVLYEYPRAAPSILNFVCEGWKKLKKDTLLSGKHVALEFIRHLLGLNQGQGGWEASGLELRSDPRALPEEGEAKPESGDSDKDGGDGEEEDYLDVNDSNVEGKGIERENTKDHRKGIKKKRQKHKQKKQKRESNEEDDVDDDDDDENDEDEDSITGEKNKDSPKLSDDGSEQDRNKKKSSFEEESETDEDRNEDRDETDQDQNETDEDQSETDEDQNETNENQNETDEEQTDTDKKRNSGECT